MEGIKYDQAKPRYDLLPMSALEDVVNVLTLGAKKYADNNWQKVEPYRERYFSACMRHLVAWREGEILDIETKLPHLAHAVCCLLFMMWRDKRGVNAG
jgi:hypothetical protein